MEKSVSFSSLLNSIKNVSDYFVSFSDDYAYCRITADSLHNIANATFKISGFGLVLVHKGLVSCEVNSQHFEFGDSTLFSLGGSPLIHLNGNNSPLDVEGLFLSTPFMQDLNLDLNALNLRSLLEDKPRRTLGLTSDQMEMAATYMRLLAENAKRNTEITFAKNIARSLMQAIIYQMLQFYTAAVVEKPRAAAQSRHLAYVQEFMRLLQLHHTRHRAISYYADKMFISPKYLSHIIKQVTGKSASDWIADFVVLEAKNMLRFSNKNVQQIAYELNFSTQSSFGKYFKHVTGISPSQYQKT